MYTINLNDVKIPARYAERIKESYDKFIKNNIGKPISETDSTLLTLENAKEKFPVPETDKVSKLEESVITSLNEYTHTKFWNAERKQAIIPQKENKKIAKIQARLIDSEAGILELGDEEFELLLEATKVDMPRNDFVMYLSDYLEELHAKSVLEKK